MTPDDPDWDHDLIIAEYIGAFAARTDLYVSNGAAVVREELTPAVVKQAVEHQFAISAYLGGTDGRTHVGALDIDRTDGAVLAKVIQQFLDQHNIPSLLVESKRGAHLWVTSWDWVQIGEMRRMLRGAVSLSLDAEDAADPQVEVFPKPGDDLAVGALRLPGMHHQKDQRVYAIHSLTRPVEPTFRDILTSHALATPEAIQRLAGRGQLPGHYPKVHGSFYGQPAKDLGPTPSASEVLSNWGVQIRPGGTGRCPKHDDKHGSLTVFRDDERVYCGAPHCPLNNGGHGVGSVLLSRMPAPG